MNGYQAPRHRADTYQREFPLDRDTALRMETAALQTGLEFALEYRDPEGSFLETSHVTTPAFRVPP